MSETHVENVACMNVMIKSLFNQILRFVTGQMADSIMKLDVTDDRGRRRVT